MAFITYLQSFLPRNKGHFAALESLRGVAAFMVVVHHYSNWVLERLLPGSAAHDMALLTKHWGGFGVWLFFVISGFLIPAILTQKPISYWPYLKRRIRRIYPLAIIAILVATAVRLLAGRAIVDTPVTGSQFMDLAMNLMLLPGVYPMDEIYGVTWTLSYEMLFYITCPLVLFAINQLPSPLLRIVVLILAAPLARLISPHHGVIGYFFIGFIAFEITRSYAASARVKALMNWGAILLTPLALGYYMLNGTGWIYRYITYENGFFIWLAVLGFVFLCQVCAATVFKGPVSRLITGPVFSVIGAISFSLYLLHVLVIGFVFRVADYFLDLTYMDNLAYFGMLAVVALASIATAFLGYIFIERPLSLDGKWPWQSRRALVDAPAT